MSENECIFFPSTILAIAGEDFSVIASDTRLSEGFQIYTRESPKSYQLYVMYDHNDVRQRHRLLLFVSRLSSVC